MQDSFILRKNMYQEFEQSTAFQKYNLNKNDLGCFCFNCSCPDYKFYKQIKDIKMDGQLEVEQIFEIISTPNLRNQVPPYTNQAAHIASNSKAKEQEYPSHVRNAADNGILLCPRCHKFLDVMGNTYRPNPLDYDRHIVHITNILKSKIALRRFLN